MSRRRFAPPSAPRVRSQLWGDPDRKTGEPQTLREWKRGPLARVSDELDSAYYGTVAYNERVLLEWTLDVLFAGLRHMGICAYGPAVPTPEEDEATLARPQPKLVNTYHWINKLHHVEEPHTTGQMPGWEFYSAWRLDILLGLADVDESRVRAFTLYMDGFNRSEIAERMGEGEEGWAPESVRSVLKQVNRQVRKRAEMNWPPKGGAQIPQPTPTLAIRRVEEVIAEARKPRKPRLRVIRGGRQMREAA